ncbi:MAG TPA: 16S rRNA (cytosine(1402)-N(4))-methyltransferase RsmH [Polyangiales bacterium]|nr:16S rRNA (cytosine(1402)-N(4))-methyltransferase RsmH [Polyangiales bacterium]
MSTFHHATVLLRETVDAVAPRAGGVYVDATLGGAGHAFAILEASAPDGVLYGIDRDPTALEAAKERLAQFGARAIVLHGTFANVRALLEEQGVTKVDGLIADLGVSSPQLDVDERGFSFARSGPLDMRMDRSNDEPLSGLLERLSAEELANVIYEYGDERKSRPIARSIKAAFELGELQTTEDLRRAVIRVTGPKRSGVDPATRTFQALRMAVNEELPQLTQLLSELPDLLREGGRAAIISFHSGEDRLVKQAFRDDSRLRPLTKKPLIAGEVEQAENPRARSAKLRAAERVVVEAS